LVQGLGYKLAIIGTGSMLQISNDWYRA